MKSFIKGIVLAVYFSIYLFVSIPALAKLNSVQVENYKNSEDTLQKLSINEFLDLVKKHHPVAQQANLILDQANAELMEARGGFDPKLYSDFSSKSFDEKNYYQVFDAGFKIPTWFGPELKGGFEQSNGDFVNPQNLTPNAGLWYAGISVPIGQGLFFDKRRAQIQSAKVFRESSKVQRMAILNELLLNAGSTYWNWTEAFGKKEILENALQLAEQRFYAIKRSEYLGDYSPIDTVEAKLQVQIREVELSQATLNFQNATADLSVYVWLEGSIPLEIPPTMIPMEHKDLNPIPIDDRLEESIDTLVSIHPEIQQSTLKIKDLTIDRRLSKEMLKPVLNVVYTPISEPVGNDPLAGISADNVKWGLNFEFPLLLRKERAKLRSASIKVKNAELDLVNKSQSIFQKAVMALNEWEYTYEQSKIFEAATLNYSTLYNAEKRRFEIGESSLFLVNSRENSFINAQTKNLELLIKNRISALKANYAFGILANETPNFGVN